LNNILNSNVTNSAVPSFDNSL